MIWQNLNFVDQTYCVPGCSLIICQNLKFVVRTLIFHSPLHEQIVPGPSFGRLCLGSVER